MKLYKNNLGTTPIVGLKYGLVGWFRLCNRNKQSVRIDQIILRYSLIDLSFVVREGRSRQIQLYLYEIIGYNLLGAILYIPLTLLYFTMAAIYYSTYFLQVNLSSARRQEESSLLYLVTGIATVILATIGLFYIGLSIWK